MRQNLRMNELFAATLIPYPQSQSPQVLPMLGLEHNQMLATNPDLRLAAALQNRSKHTRMDDSWRLFAPSRDSQTGNSRVVGSLAVQARNYNSKDTRDENNKGDMELDDQGGAEQEGQGAVTARSVVEDICCRIHAAYGALDTSGSLDGAFGAFGALDGRKEPAGMRGFWEDERVGEEKDGSQTSGQWPPELNRIAV
ncbi:hypothetical protein DFH09DRAFT_1088423 [Mycena vulgaris]|nr:hypothetical protein DFH09DRAFT_1088423 [Mycena vulgaris]